MVSEDFQMPEREELEIIHNPDNDKGVYKLEFWARTYLGLSVWDVGGEEPCVKIYPGKEVWIEVGDKAFMKLWIDESLNANSDPVNPSIHAIIDWCPKRMQYACTGMLDSKVVLLGKL